MNATAPWRGAVATRRPSPPRQSARNKYAVNGLIPTPLVRRRGMALTGVARRKLE